MYKFRTIRRIAIAVVLTLSFSNSFIFAEDILRVLAADERINELDIMRHEGLKCTIGTKTFYYRSVHNIKQDALICAKRGDFSPLTLDWDMSIYDWLLFVNYAKGINEAIKEALSEKDYQSFNEPNAFLLAAIRARVAMIENYILPLSDEGKQRIETITDKILNDTLPNEELESLLTLLMGPPEGWFVNAHQQSRLQELVDKGIVKKGDTFLWRAVNGCTGQCDHCDSALGVFVTPMSWITIRHSQEVSNTLGVKSIIDWEHCELIRDYYDFVYNKDFCDVAALFPKVCTMTSGCLPGSVGENALREAVEKEFIERDIEISVVPNALMRRLGYELYKDMLKNMCDILTSEQSSVKLRTYGIRRLDDPEWVNPEKIANAVVDEIRQENPSLTIDLEAYTTEVSPIGRILHLQGEGVQFKITSSWASPITFLEPTRIDETTGDVIDAGSTKFVLLPNGTVLQWKSATAAGGNFYNFEVVMTRLDDTHLLCSECRAHRGGKKDSPCPGRVAVLESWGLTSTGGIRLPLSQILRALAADERLDTSALADEVERARLLPKKLKAYVEQLEGLRAGGLSASDIVAKQDNLTTAITAALPVPPLRPYEKSAQEALPMVRIDSPRGILVVGADGYIGREHLQVAGQLCKANDNLIFLGGLDIRRLSEETKELFSKNNLGQEPPEFTDAETAVSDAKSKYGLDPSQIIVIIATPDEKHAENIKQFADLGVIEFIVEKPVAGTAEEITDVKNLASGSNLKIAGAGQVFGSVVVEKIRNVMQEKKFQPTFYLLSWSKDRRERSREGENMGPGKRRTNILAHFDLFHQLGILEVLDGNRVAGIDYAYSRDMVLPEDKIFKDHGLGVALVNLESGAKAICYSSFVEPGRTRPNEKALALVGADGSVIIADVASADEEAESVIYVPKEGEMEIYLVQENRSSMLARMDAWLIEAVASGKKLASTSPASLDFQARMVDLMKEAGKLAEAGPKPYSAISIATQKSGIELTNI